MKVESSPKQVAEHEQANESRLSQMFGKLGNIVLPGRKYDRETAIQNLSQHLGEEIAANLPMCSNKQLEQLEVEVQSIPELKREDGNSIADYAGKLVANLFLKEEIANRFEPGGEYSPIPKPLELGPQRYADPDIWRPDTGLPLTQDPQYRRALEVIMELEKG